MQSVRAPDLTGGPVILSVPQMGDRYWMMQLIDAWEQRQVEPGAKEQKVARARRVIRCG
jgi:hypothetical protein